MHANLSHFSFLHHSNFIFSNQNVPTFPHAFPFISNYTFSEFGILSVIGILGRVKRSIWKNGCLRSYDLSDNTKNLYGTAGETFNLFYNSYFGQLWSPSSISEVICTLQSSLKCTSANYMAFLLPHSNFHFKKSWRDPLVLIRRLVQENQSP